MDFKIMGVSLETVIILVLVLFIVIILFSRRKGGALAALSASVPLFWLLSRKLGKGGDELQQIRDDYDRKLAKLQQEFDAKLAALKQALSTDLQHHDVRADAIHTDIQSLDTRAKKKIKTASPDELEAIARALLSIPKN
jgi:hypothetical protein